MIHRWLRVAGYVATVVVLLASGPVTAAETGRRTITGTIGSADFRIEMPRRWNGTLVLFSHGDWPTTVGAPPGGIWLANRPPDRSRTATWLLDNGYALAASNFTGVTGYVTEPALHDQIALLDWFDANIGHPRRTLSTGQSHGGLIAVELAERNPGRFAGVATMCAELDAGATLNTALDMLYAVKTLLVPAKDQDIDLVLARDPKHSNDLLAKAINDAVATPQGRARIALAASFGNIPGAFSGHEPPPSTLDGQIRAQAEWLSSYLLFAGPYERAADIERRAGGNPSWNLGIDYRAQLARSALTRQVRTAYASAGLDLDTDLARLNAAPRIAASPSAVGYLYRFWVPSGRTPVPVITVHTPKDGGAVPDQERWYAQQVDRRDQLRQLFTDRGMHCAISDAEELVAIRALLQRIDTGRWPDLRPSQLNREAAAYGPDYQNVLDFPTFQDKAMPPAFLSFTPPRSLRPSR
ncbi:alpha/beta hydrolase family protein [Fodinicola acaciae]|uniref:alpha/beta hydrolase family protein n=1 Tax=Fodinicola acaciae TaxID=2681555 RepID=UPI001C9E28C3|nr:esterase family protein [Fodinicola acaciae]